MGFERTYSREDHFADCVSGLNAIGTYFGLEGFDSMADPTGRSIEALGKILQELGTFERLLALHKPLEDTKPHP